MITAKIDVNKIDKTALFKGKKGTYLDILLIETPNSQYADYMVVQGLTKERRDAGEKGEILGDGKVWGEQRPEVDTAPVQAPVVPAEPDDDDLPF